MRSFAYCHCIISRANRDRWLYCVHVSTSVYECVYWRLSRYRDVNSCQSIDSLSLQLSLARHLYTVLGGLYLCVARVPFPHHPIIKRYVQSFPFAWVHCSPPYAPSWRATNTTISRLTISRLTISRLQMANGNLIYNTVPLCAILCNLCITWVFV